MINEAANAQELDFAGSERDLASSPYGQTYDKVQSIQNYPLDHVVARYAKDYDVPLSLAREHERELKRFFALAAINPKYDYGMAGPVDKLWHTFILFSKEYAQFCDSLIGRFLHHYPDRVYTGQAQGLNVQTDDTLEWYQAFLRDYVVTFKETPPAHIWPDVSDFPSRATPAESLCRVCGSDPWDPH